MRRRQLRLLGGAEPIHFRGSETLERKAAARRDFLREIAERAIPPVPERGREPP